MNGAVSMHPGDIVKSGMTRPSTKVADEPTAEAADSSSAKAASSEGVDVEVSPHLTEEEASRLMAPENAVEEEEKLRQQREQENIKALQAAFNGENALLDQDRFGQLDKLLDQTGMYTKFLKEQMEQMTEEMDGSANQAVGSKRKTGRQGGNTRKKGAAGAVSAQMKVQQELVPLIKGELRPYQLKGIKWIISLYQNGLNGILADQMGLGKTVQTIGFLSHLRSKGVPGPHMVIGPLSTLSNWVAEFERWCPSIPVILYQGSRAERQKLRSTRMPTGAVKDSFPVVVTSYEIVIADVKHLQRYAWKYIVVDEGHRLKNFNCKLLRELRTIPTANKLLLSGTPLQNNLSELWSLLNFLLPDVFKSLADFESWFDFSGVGEAGADELIVAQEQRNRVVSKLHNLLRPFLLRRLKSDVESSLPSKAEIVLYAHMTADQKRLNQQLKDRTVNEAMAKVENGQRGAAISRLNNVLMQMRKNCNHPDLITSALDPSPMFPSAAELLEQCGKMQLLDRLLKHLKARGHKVLIFSQMTKMLDLLDTYLEQLGHRTTRIDGSIAWQERQEAMRAFNSDPDMFVFLLSTRAGGLGINLTSADTVIIYDSDWNPHQDLQAMDRCHRIGQQKPVLVLRLATAHSVEGKLLKRARSKLALERLVIKKGAFLPGETEEDHKGTSMKADELLEILKEDKDSKRDEAQSGVVSDKMLEKLLDRTHLTERIAPPYPLVGVGYEVVQHAEGSGLLSGVE
ncbi:probable global transcription activator SNF2L1 [Coccomyxa sp. Obi]|nr:probable global transcription activator SNF2L1 [Coccomyxa sp. Obi]